MLKRKVFVVFALLTILGLAVLGGISTDYFFYPIETSAQQSQNNPFAEINELAKQNKLNPTTKKSKAIVGKVIDALSVLDIPITSKEEVVQQVATAHLNGASAIDENNIAAAINNLAVQSSAPAYAFTNVEQVKIVRKYLNRLMPDLIASNGNMNDIEALAVFTGILSQKFDNEAFMVTPAEFTASLGTNPAQPFPGTSSANALVLETSQTTAKMSEMANLLSSYTSSGNMLTSTNIITNIGIQ